MAALVCLRPGHRGRMFYRVLLHRRRTGERRSFGETGHAALIAAAHLAATVKTLLKRIQYRPDLIDGFLARTGLTLNLQPRDPRPNPFNRCTIIHPSVFQKDFNKYFRSGPLMTHGAPGGKGEWPRTVPGGR